MTNPEQADKMSADELGKRIARGEKWKIAEPEQTDLTMSASELANELEKLHDRRKPYAGGVHGQQIGQESYWIVASGQTLSVLIEAANALRAQSPAPTAGGQPFPRTDSQESPAGERVPGAGLTEDGEITEGVIEMERDHVLSYLNKDMRGNPYLEKVTQRINCIFDTALAHLRARSGYAEGFAAAREAAAKACEEYKRPQVRPTVSELQAMLQEDTAQKVSIEPDGSITTGYSSGAILASTIRALEPKEPK